MAKVLEKYRKAAEKALKKYNKNSIANKVKNDLDLTVSEGLEYVEVLSLEIAGNRDEATLLHDALNEFEY